jgi:hypothetical protein
MEKSLENMSISKKIEMGMKLAIREEIEVKDDEPDTDV